MEVFKEVSKILADFSFKDATMIDIRIISRLCDNKTIITNSVSTYENPDLAEWSETEWGGWFITKNKANKKLGFRVKEVISVSVNFSYKDSAIYHLEITDLQREGWFNRLIIPARAVKNGENYLVTPQREIYYYDPEKYFIDSVEWAVKTPQIVSDSRFTEVDSDLPLALLEDVSVKESLAFAADF